MNDGACDDTVGWKMKQFMSAGGASNGVQVDAVKGASRRGVAGVRFVVGLNTAAKRMLTIDVAVQRKMCDDGPRRMTFGDAALGREHVDEFDRAVGQGLDHDLGDAAVGQ